MVANVYGNLIKVLILFVGVATSAASAKAPRSTTVRARTTLGTVNGYLGKNSNRFVLPYALPPTGDRRFADPVALPSFRVYDGTNLPPPCAQSPMSDGGISSTAEDCLYLTVYTPPGSIKRNANLPVFVWVHGGSFAAGSTSVPSLDGSNLSKSQNMIVVTVQYRLGVLGFLRSDSLGVTGNFGLKDLIMALTYIQAQIGSFGGNPAAVTLAGQSSGAEMIKSLLVTPSATSLFAQTILHSAPLNWGDQSVATGNAVGDIVVQHLKCTTLDCLRAAAVSDILGGAPNMSTVDPESYVGSSPYELLRVVADGTLVTRQFGDVTLSGGNLEGSTKPMILTTVKDEGCSSIGQMVQSPVPVSDYNAIIRNLVSEAKASLLDSSGLYTPAPSAPDGAREAVSALITDSGWTCFNQQAAVNLTAANPSAPIYLAEFDVGIAYANPSVPFCANKVAHEDDIYTVFGTSPSKSTRAQGAVTREVMARWGAFAHTGTPNPTNGPFASIKWNPVASATNLNLLIFGGGRNGASSTSPTQRAAECQVGTGFWGRTLPFDGQSLPPVSGTASKRDHGAQALPKHHHKATHQ